MTLQFQIRKTELLFFSIRSVWKKKGIFKTILQILLWMWIILIAAQWVKDTMLWLWCALMLPGALFVPWIFNVAAMYLLNYRKGVLDECRMCLKDGVLEIHRKGWARIPARYLEDPVITKTFVIITNAVSRENKTYILIPVRAFLEGGRERFITELEAERNSSAMAHEEERKAFAMSCGEDRNASAMAHEEDRNASAAAHEGERSVPAMPHGEMFYTYPCSPQLLADLLASSDAASRALKGRGKEWLFKGAVVLGMFAATAVFFGWIDGVIIGVITLVSMLLRNHAGSYGQYLEWIEGGKGFRHLLGQWTLVSEEGCLWSYVNEWGNGYEWSALKTLVETERFYFLGTREGITLLVVPKSVFVEKGEEQRFLDCLAGHGIQKILSRYKVVPKPGLEKGRKAAVFLMTAAAAAGMAVVLYTKVQKDSSFPSVPYVPYEDEFVFRQDDYPDYVPLAKQKEVLEELGIEVPDSVMEESRRWMEESETGRVYVEGYPYYSLLSVLGMPEYDEESFKITAYPSQVYWFDWEGWDIMEDYLDILKAVETLSDGSVVFENARIDDGEADWENGRGRLTLSFECGGKEYDFQLKLSGDWLDESIINKINNVLRGQKGAERVYSCSDGGQGAVVFYCDKEWAEEFKKATGIELE